MPSPADLGDLTNRPISFGYKTIHQCRLADPGMPEQDGDLAGQQVRHREQRIIDACGGYGQFQVGELLAERFRRGEVGLGQAENRGQPAGVGGDQRPV